MIESDHTVVRDESKREMAEIFICHSPICSGMSEKHSVNQAAILFLFSWYLNITFQEQQIDFINLKFQIDSDNDNFPT